jgi:hypothetical protein
MHKFTHMFKSFIVPKKQEIQKIFIGINKWSQKLPSEHFFRQRKKLS